MSLRLRDLQQILDKFRYMLTNHGWQLRDSFTIDLKPEWVDLYNKKKECLILNARQWNRN